MNKRAQAIEIAVISVIFIALIIFGWHKYSSSKSEAQLSKSVRSLATLIKDIDNFYTENREFKDIALMSKIALNKDNWFFIKSEPCLHFSTIPNYLVIRRDKSPSKLCYTLVKYDAIASLLSGKSAPSEDSARTNIYKSDIVYIRVGKNPSNEIL